MNLYTAFQKIAVQRPGAPAYLWGDEQVTYAQLDQAADRFTHDLSRSAGVTSGNRIGILLKNQPNFAAILLAIWKLDAVAVPLNIFLKREEIADITADAGLQIIVSETAFEPLASQLPIVPFYIDKPLHASSSASQVPTISPPGLAVIIYSSGTTGRPKGAMLTHANLLANVESCRIILQVDHHERIVVLLPMFHSYMLTVGTLLPLLIGGTVVLIKSVSPLKNVLQEIIQHGATLLPAVPQFFRALLHPGVPVDLPLRLCITGGGPLPLEILQQFQNKFPIPLLEGYGLSEASPVVSFTPIRGPWKSGSIGKAVPGVEIAIRSDTGESLGPQQTGEICVRGSNVMLGYWNQPGETEKAIRDGWLLTGDVGHFDHDDFFYITDRKKDMLIVNGINVYPREIEEQIYRFTGIKEAAVVGIPDARRGEQAVAYVALDEGATLDVDGLREFLKNRLADYKVPRTIHVMPALPRNATGKILKRELREMRD